MIRIRQKSHQRCGRNPSREKDPELVRHVPAAVIGAVKKELGPKERGNKSHGDERCGSERHRLHDGAVRFHSLVDVVGFVEDVLRNEVE